MRKSRVAFAFFCSALSILGVNTVYADTSKDIGVGYVQGDTQEGVIQSGFGQCLRTQFWSPKHANEHCDPEYFHHTPPPVAQPRPATHPYVYHPVSAPKAPVPVPVKHKMTFAAGTFFDTDMATLRPSAMRVLDQLLAAIKPVDLEVIIITGYTDNRGSLHYNQALSEQRAQMVRRYLIQKGMDANLLYAEGKASDDPVGNNATAEGRAKNRRVDIEVIGTSTKGDMKKITTAFQDNTNTKDRGPHYKKMMTGTQHMMESSKKRMSATPSPKETEQKAALKKIYGTPKTAPATKPMP